MESLNAIWKWTRILKKIKAEEAQNAAEDLVKFYDKLNVIGAREYAMETTQIAVAEGIAVYDAVFIAAGQKINGTLLTADRKLHATAQKTINSHLLVMDRS